MKSKLRDCAAIIAGGTPKTTIPEYWGGNIPWLSIADMATTGRFVTRTEKTITELGVANSSTHVLDENDIIVSARGTVGLVVMVGKKMAFNQSCFGIHAKSNADPTYLYYSLIGVVNRLKQESFGSVFNSINAKLLEDIEIELPDLKTQRRISGYLAAIDDKISINSKINDNLGGICFAS